jgi:hypothetical protein
LGGLRHWQKLTAFITELGFWGSTEDPCELVEKLGSASKMRMAAAVRDG